ncbi:Nucleolin [Tupaia chinensis]|uniref:Nucleolin n=1 Tax=Tupaia chinensis TaxID=246437 RepID=L9L7C2_TUPCH|nr:Nucleolin [Tupaia chinensis]
MTKQKTAPEAKKQKVEAIEPTASFHLFVGNLNNNKSIPELKTDISDVFAKNDTAIVDVRIGTSRKFGYVDFESAEDLEKALKLTSLKVFGNGIKIEKPKGKDNKKDPELKEVFEDAMEIRITSKDGKSKGIAYVEFKTEADAEKTFKEKQGIEIDGRSISLYYTVSKSRLLEESGSSKGFGFVDFNSEQDAKAAKEAMEDDKIDGNKVILDWAKPKGEGDFGGHGGGRGGFGGQGGGRRGRMDLVAEAEEALESEMASEEAEEEEETISHKERRSFNSFSVPLSSLFHLK